MTEKELKEIEERWWNPFRLGDLPKNGLDDVSDLLAEVRRLNQQAKQQQQTIEAMKCCGNCSCRRNDGFCIEKLDYLDGAGKCDQWQVKEGQ